MPQSSDNDYKARLGEVLRRRDPAELHLFLRQSAANYGDEGQVAEVEDRSHGEMEDLMHRMILTRSDLADLHAASKAWLEARHPGQPLPSSAHGGSSASNGRASGRGGPWRREGRPGGGRPRG